jgi:hypothetical protein
MINKIIFLRFISKDVEKNLVKYKELAAILLILLRDQSH